MSGDPAPGGDPAPAVLTTPAEARAWSRAVRAEGRRIGLVPTMGALHGGHLALVADAAARADAVCVSIFVNPLQFDQRTDFDAYPRPIDGDLAACAELGVDAVYAPTAAVMYPEGFQTRVVPGPLAETMEGPGRPGHFEGVTTVVTKLFAAVAPDVAIFGEKDFQQLAIVRRLARDLDLGVEVVGHPIVREADGVAMSSRNRRLDADHRRAATCIPRALAAAAADASAGGSPASIVEAARRTVSSEPLARHEYTTVFDPVTLQELDALTPGDRRPGRARVATAVWFGDVRLIDNRDLFAG
jgi:pantoate--beta-alanine ligase